MSPHRFRGLVDSQPIPGPSSSVPSVSGFMACPLTTLQGMMGQMLLWQQSYQLAFEQARAVLRAEPFDAPAADRAVWDYQCAVNEEVPG